MPMYGSERGQNVWSVYLLSGVGRKDGYRRKVGAEREGEKGTMVRTLFTPGLNIHSYMQRPLMDLVEHRKQHRTLLNSVRVNVKSWNVPYKNNNRESELLAQR